MYNADGNRMRLFDFLHKERKGRLSRTEVNREFTADEINSLTKRDLGVMLCFSMQHDDDLDDNKQKLAAIVSDDFGDDFRMAVSLCSRDYKENPNKGYYPFEKSESVIFIDRPPVEKNLLLVQHGWNSGRQIYGILYVLSHWFGYSDGKVFACFSHLPSKNGSKEGPHYRYVSRKLLEEHVNNLPQKR